MEPRIPRIGFPKAAHVPPGQQQRILDRILGAVAVAKDEPGDVEQPGMGEPDQVRVRVHVPVAGLDDQLSLHLRHRFGARHSLALSQSMSWRRGGCIPDDRVGNLAGTWGAVPRTACRDPDSHLGSILRVPVIR